MVAPFPCATGPSWHKSCLIPQQIVHDYPCALCLGLLPPLPFTLPSSGHTELSWQRGISGKDLSFCLLQKHSCNGSLLFPIIVSFHIPAPFSGSGRGSQASTLLWAAALPPASQCLPSGPGTWPCSLPPGDMLWPR